jgi:hypothetical protein
VQHAELIVWLVHAEQAYRRHVQIRAEQRPDHLHDLFGGRQARVAVCDLIEQGEIGFTALAIGDVGGDSRHPHGAAMGGRGIRSGCRAVCEDCLCLDLEPPHQPAGACHANLFV